MHTWISNWIFYRSTVVALCTLRTNTWMHYCDQLRSTPYIRQIMYSFTHQCRFDWIPIFGFCSRQLVSLLNMISNSSATYIWSILFFFFCCCCWLFVLLHERGVRQLEHIWFICLQIFANTHVFVTFVETFLFRIQTVLRRFTSARHQTLQHQNK